MYYSNKEIAVLLATYEGEKYIELQLQSLVDQTFDSFMCYIHDDNSSDRTIEIIKKYENKYPDKFKLLNYKNCHGAVGNFLSLAEFVKENTTEPYIFFCDQDDYWFPTKLEKQIQVLKKNIEINKPILVYCDQEIVDGDLNIIAKSGMLYSRRKAGIDDSFKELVFENCAAGCTIGINRTLLERAMTNINKNHIVMHDWWFMLVARCFGEIYYIDEPLMKYRQHGSNTLGADSKKLQEKINKYFRSMKKSVKRKALHVKKCEAQISEIASFCNGEYEKELESICEVLKQNKFCRMIYFIKQGYIKYNELFTALFV